MKLLNDIDNQNNNIKEITRKIDYLLVEQTLTVPQTLYAFGRYLLRRKVIGKVFGGNDKEVKKDEDSLKKYKDRIKDWQDSADKVDDIDDVVNDVENILGTDKAQNDRLREMLVNIAEMQKEIMEDLLHKKGLTKVTVGFNKPVEFKLIRGKAAGKEMKLEGSKTYDVFKVDGKEGNFKVYFIYKTRNKVNWLKDYGIMFTMKLKTLEPNKKHDRVEIKIAYMNENLIRDGEYKILKEEYLTKRAMVEIKATR